jgi:hypothetical protein
VSRAIADGVKTDVKLERTVLSLRRHRSRVAALWLAVQCASFAVAPALLAAAGHAEGQVTICTCPGDHRSEACPMHNAAVETSKDDAEGDLCTMRSSSAATDAALLSLSSGLGIASTAFTIQAPRASDRICLDSHTPADRAVLPDSPPPRV